MQVISRVVLFVVFLCGFAAGVSAQGADYNILPFDAARPPMSGRVIITGEEVQITAGITCGNYVQRVLARGKISSVQNSFLAFTHPSGVVLVPEQDNQMDFLVVEGIMYQLFTRRSNTGHLLLVVSLPIGEGHKVDACLTVPMRK